MNNSSLQIERLISGSINVNNNVIFEEILAVNNIAYDNTTGIITLNEPGTYCFDWWIAAQASASVNGPVFTLTTSQGDSFIGNSPVKTDQISGTCIVEVLEGNPVDVSLINSSTQPFYYSTITPVKAFMRVVGNPTVKQNDNSMFAESDEQINFTTAIPFTALQLPNIKNLGNFVITSEDNGFIVPKTGRYLISYCVPCGDELYPSEVAVFKNTTLIPESYIYVSNQFYKNSIKTFITDLIINDIISLQVTSIGYISIFPGSYLTVALIS